MTPLEVYWSRPFILSLAILFTILACFVIANVDKWIWRK